MIRIHREPLPLHVPLALIRKWQTEKTLRSNQAQKKYYIYLQAELMKRIKACFFLLKSYFKLTASLLANSDRMSIDQVEIMILEMVIPHPTNELYMVPVPHSGLIALKRLPLIIPKSLMISSEHHGSQSQGTPLMPTTPGTLQRRVQNSSGRGVDDFIVRTAEYRFYPLPF